MAEAEKFSEFDEVQFVATADHDCGDIVQVGGLAGVVEGLSGVKNGETGNARVKGGYKVDAASGTTFAEGAAVQWDNTNKLAVATGDFALGKAEKAKISGELEVKVKLNE